MILLYLYIAITLLIARPLAGHYACLMAEWDHTHASAGYWVGAAFAVPFWPILVPISTTVWVSRHMNFMPKIGAEKRAALKAAEREQRGY